jgi:hypothetical protein
MSQPGLHKHQGGAPVWEITNYPSSPPDFPVHLFQGIVGSNPYLVISSGDGGARAFKEHPYPASLIIAHVLPVQHLLVALS